MISCELRVASYELQLEPQVASYFYELRVAFYENKIASWKFYRFSSVTITAL